MFSNLNMLDIYSSVSPELRSNARPARREAHKWLLVLSFFIITLASPAALYAGDELPEILPSSTSQRLELKNGVVFELSGPQTEQQIHDFNLLTAEQKESFYKKRLLMITPIAQFFAFFGQGRQDFFQKRMAGINNEILDHATTLLDSTEFGVMVATGPMGGAAVGKWGMYNALNVGISTGVDVTNKYTAVDLFVDLESLKNALPVVAQVGINFKFMVYASHASRGVIQRGRYFTPPLPVATNDFPTNFCVGVAFGACFPPLLDAFYAYTTQVFRFSLLKYKIPFDLAKIRSTRPESAAVELTRRTRRALKLVTAKLKLACLNLIK
jgi:hypothetical protein